MTTQISWHLTKKQKQLEGAAIDFETAPPPELIDVASVFDGPMISVNMFGTIDTSLPRKGRVAGHRTEDGTGAGRTGRVCEGFHTEE